MHWSNPPHLIPVIEVIRGEQTSEETAQRTVELVEKIGMVPAIVDRDVAGFVENRILYAIMREALHLLDEGVASAEAIDTITKWGIGYKLAVIGPLELLDMAGLDIYTSVASYLNASLNASPEVSKTVTDKVAAGQAGHQDPGRSLRLHPGANPAAAAAARPQARRHAKALADAYTSSRPVELSRNPLSHRRTSGSREALWALVSAWRGVLCRINLPSVAYSDTRSASADAPDSDPSRSRR